MLCLFRSFILFPAYAGVIPSFLAVAVFSLSFPRIRGGDPKFKNMHRTVTGFSPHTRG